MLHKYLKFIWGGTLVIGVLAPFVFFSSSMQPRENSNHFLYFWHELIFPFEYVWTSFDRGLAKLVDRYVFFLNVAEENETLKRDLAHLKVKVADYEEKVQETNRLRSLLGFSARFEKKVIIAEVVGGSTNLPFQSLRITRGSSDGIKVGMPVVAADGIVGRVIRTGFHFADVQLLVDTNFNLDVLLQRTRVRGVLEGISGDRCRLQLHRRAEVKIGDTVISSGIVGAFPKGLPIGRVMRISYELDNVSQIIIIEPWVDYRRLDEVMVLSLPSKELDKIVETAGNSWLENAVPQATGG